MVILYLERLYLQSMELVRDWNASVASYDLLLGRKKDIITEAAPVGETRDVLVFEDRQAAESAHKKIIESAAVRWI